MDPDRLRVLTPGEESAVVFLVVLLGIVVLYLVIKYAVRAGQRRDRDDR